MKKGFRDIASKGIMPVVWDIVGFFITIIRGLLIIGGGAIAASLADVIFGALTLDLLFVNTAGANTAIKYGPLVVSMGASGIQLILWQMIQKQGGMGKVFKSKDKVWIAVFLGVILMKFADDFMDITIVNYLMVGNIFPSVLGNGFFNVLKYAVMFIIWMLTGFSEIFVVNAVEIMKDKDKPKQEQQKSQQQTSKQDQPPFRSRTGYIPTHKKPHDNKRVPPFYLDERTREEWFKDLTDES